MAMKQLTVFVPNEKGAIVPVTKLLAEHHVNLRALSIAETSDYGVLRLIVDDAEKATYILHQHGFILSMTPVSVVSVPDEIGGLAPVLEALASGHMDVEYMYSLFTHKEGRAYMVFRIEDEAKFAELLRPYRIKLADKEDLGLK